MTDTQQGRREFVKKLAYATPVVLTLAAKPSLASSGSGPRKGHKGHKHWDKDRKRGIRGKKKGWY